MAPLSLISGVLFFSALTFANEQAEDLCKNQQCELYPHAICLSSTTAVAPHSNRTLFMDDSGNVIDDDDCDCDRNHKLNNEQCLETDDGAAVGEYYISIDISFDVEQSTAYQNQRDILFEDIGECVDGFISAISFINDGYDAYIQSYSYSKHDQNDNDFFDENEDKGAMFERFNFNFVVNDADINNETFLYDPSTDKYQQAVQSFAACALSLSSKMDSKGFKNVFNTQIDTKLLKVSSGDNIGGAHFFVLTSFAFGAMLFMKKSIYLPLTSFWCNIFSCCKHFHICYCYNPCTSATKDCGMSCCGFGCGCINGCCPGFTLNLCCWSCHCCF